MSKNIEKIIYINLDKSVERKQQIEKELIQMDLLQFERFPAIEKKNFGCLGCAISHLEVLKLAKKRGYKNILILEDDFTFLISKEELEKELEQLFSKETFVEFDVCMLSYNLLDGKDSKYPFLTKVYDAQTASGYIVNHTIYDALIELYEESAYMLERTQMHWIYTNDQSWKILQPQNNWYCFKKRMGKQRPGFSEIGQKYTQPQY